MGLEDGMRGDIDTNEKFSDGYRENDPAKKSAAGQFLSDYSGIRGGARVGETIGKWGGGLACGAVAGSYLSGFVAAGVAAGALAGAWPVIGAVLLTAGAAFFGGAALGVVGKYVGGFTGAIAGAIGGAAVGTYNAVFRRGYYAKGKKPDPVDIAPATVPEAAPTPEQPLEPGQNLAQPQPLVSQAQPPQGTAVGQDHPRVQAVLDNTTPPASEKDAALAANGRVPQMGFMSRMGQIAAVAGGSMLAAVGVKSAVNSMKERRNAKLGEAPVIAPVADDFTVREAAPLHDAAPTQPADMSRAKEQLHAQMPGGMPLGQQSTSAPQPVTAQPPQHAANTAEAPVGRSFAQREQLRQTRTAQQGTQGLN